MIVHAGAFVLYILVAIIDTVIDFFDPADNDYYFHWLLLLVFAWGAFICLIFLIWHLGTKRKVPVYYRNST